MSTLHIFSKPLNYYSANQLENLILSDDNVLLVGDACFAKKQFRQFADTLLILEQDAQVRAIKLTDNDKAISYEDFVALTLSTNQSITW
ncbi:tRNA 2-thiouridine-synthesizing protein [Pseudoalteromonas sp. NZS127_1]|jgi:tRNA 2-thiouridine synthesizing protein B|uniref:DsrH/TusB family sulfur metabolism protein n=2 Tax=Pseudoalteromonas arctica TaxID=394751 RepID=A0AAP6Y0C4_9GAMM|nr:MULTISPECIES: DsrH/TusB family sulfur metabolism protein [Pseudoalteromonas]ATC86392.1 tRNA 2-thiouridine synthesizing protein B [Pseudoalteromonas arctica A 37-1-2]MBG9990259.1 tRNA 2-thiouridine-synthesizing protein [Pseudoalteromonas sp. NZS37]MBG9993643.1 tRNA 2-thiouridine-synthesizing protein [Pseudoalteromonas sp. NZS127_1]MBH0000277.1 tRNA 2-thiouridine-synthesizing protein [Pseudoalteromonas sp. NSLLW24]MBH0017025.1 tRNA 2-thiouridine-synthesizing protein [Pseudoalteromonas sp. NGC